MKLFVHILFLLTALSAFAQVNYFELGIDAFNQKEYDKAIQFYTLQLKKKKNNNTYFNRALSYYKAGEYQSAIEDFTIVLDKDSLDYEAWYNRGLAYFALETYKKAYYDFKKCNTLNKDFVPAFTSLGMCYYVWNKPEEAIEQYKNGLKISESSQLYYNRALAYQKLENFKESEKDFNRALNLEKTVANYWGRADLYFNLKEYDKAIADYNLAIQIDSTNAQLYFNKGFTHYTNFQDKDAIKAFEKTLALDSNYLDAKWHLALCHYSENNYQKALFYYKKVEEEKPNYPFLKNLDENEIQKKIALKNNLVYVVLFVTLLLLAIYFFLKLFYKKNQEE